MRVAVVACCVALLVGRAGEAGQTSEASPLSEIGLIELTGCLAAWVNLYWVPVVGRTAGPPPMVRGQ